MPTYCTCWVDYPNPSHKRANGWKCKDKYICIRQLEGLRRKTKCVKREAKTMPKENQKQWYYGCAYMSGETIEETIKLYEREIKAYKQTVRTLERTYPDYPTLPATRGTIKHFQKIVKWLKEFQKIRQFNNIA